MLVRARCKWRLQSFYSKYVPINKKPKALKKKKAPVVLEIIIFMWISLLESKQ